MSGRSDNGQRPKPKPNGRVIEFAPRKPAPGRQRPRLNWSPTLLLLPVALAGWLFVAAVFSEYAWTFGAKSGTHSLWLTGGPSTLYILAGLALLGVAAFSRELGLRAEKLALLVIGVLLISVPFSFYATAGIASASAGVASSAQGPFGSQLMALGIALILAELVALIFLARSAMRPPLKPWLSVHSLIVLGWAASANALAKAAYLIYLT